MKRRLMFFPALLLLAACATEKFPYPPQFVTAQEMPAPELAPPPAKGSATYENEIKRIVAAQAKLTPAEKAVLVKENHIAPEMMVYSVLGERYSEEQFPKLYALLKHAASDAWRISDQEQDYWMSPRPWYADDRVRLLVPKITRPGYPSGHTVTNTVWASVLSEIFPSKRLAFFERASQIGYHRVDGGAHFPHDVEGGKKLGALIFARMQEDDQFQQELSEAKQEVTEGAKLVTRARAASAPAALVLPLHP
jgi:acid phosphatase (class A)